MNEPSRTRSLEEDPESVEYGKENDHINQQVQHHITNLI